MILNVAYNILAITGGGIQLLHSGSCKPLPKISQVHQTGKRKYNRGSVVTIPIISPTSCSLVSYLSPSLTQDGCEPQPCRKISHLARVSFGISPPLSRCGFSGFIKMVEAAY